MYSFDVFVTKSFLTGSICNTTGTQVTLYSPIDHNLKTPKGACRVVSCCVVSCHFLTCPVLSCPVISCPILNFNALFSLCFRVFHLMRRVFVLCCVASCHVLSRVMLSFSAVIYCFYSDLAFWVKFHIESLFCSEAVPAKRKLEGGGFFTGTAFQP